MLSVLTLLHLALLTPISAILYDDFTTYNSSVWSYADESLGTTDKCKVWYLKNHSMVNADLSLGEGRGLRMLMSSNPCKAHPACGGAKMAADHVSSVANHQYGDYELRMRAPYAVNGSGGTCNQGIYAYFTAGSTEFNPANCKCLFVNVA